MPGERNQSVPDTNTPAASLREAQSSGPQWEGGFAPFNGLVIASDSSILVRSSPAARTSRALVAHQRIVFRRKLGRGRQLHHRGGVAGARLHHELARVEGAQRRPMADAEERR